MKLDSGEEAVVAIIIAIAMALLILTGTNAWYHYGYYEGRVDQAKVDRLTGERP